MNISANCVSFDLIYVNVYQIWSVGDNGKIYLEKNCNSTGHKLYDAMTSWSQKHASIRQKQ
jgi:hypothetical protein